MAIARFENITVKNLTFGSNSFGEQSTTQTEWFKTRARVHAVKNHIRISDKYRVYSDIVEFTLNYTPNTLSIINNQNLYSINWKNKTHRFLLISLFVLIEKKRKKITEIEDNKLIGKDLAESYSDILKISDM